MRDSQQIAHEQHGQAAHAHNIGVEHRGQEDHLTAHERTRQAQEHTNAAYLHSEEGHVKAPPHPNEQEIAELAYRFWQERGCPEGSSGHDWYRAVELLRSRA